RQVIPEYDNFSTGVVLADPLLIRETHLLGYGIEPALGIAWLRRVKTQVAWRLEKVNNDGSFDENGNPTTAATQGGVLGLGRASLAFDFRAREFAVMRGAALYLGFDLSNKSFGSDFDFWRAGASWEQGFRFFRQHNFILYGGANFGHNLPFWLENTGGGPNL